MATIEQLIEEVLSLPPAEQQRLREALDREAHLAQSRQAQDRQLLRADEQRWLAEHKEEYVGQWVAVEGENLIAHGTNARAVYRAARDAGIRVPFLVRVKPADQLPFGGW
ncbi:MAG: hypothetical protein H0T92_16535 [Pyrinomonadaceae bacterium]|jgi:hypothetical protein|nr:hypothetical protein [Pyrinomonadaceae bacterium]